jgi:hypothetical protein
MKLDVFSFSVKIKKETVHFSETKYLHIQKKILKSAADIVRNTYYALIKNNQESHRRFTQNIKIYTVNLYRELVDIYLHC